MAVAPARPSIATPRAPSREALAPVGRAGTWLRTRLVELRWPLTLMLVLVALVDVPYRIAESHAAIGFSFGGMFWGVNDTSQYHSAMRQGAASSSWLIYDRFTQEPHAPALLYPLYVALGKLSWLLGTGVHSTFLTASTAGRLALLLAVWYFTRLLSDEAKLRRMGLVLIVFGSGLSSVLAIIERMSGITMPLAGHELSDPEFSTFLVLFTAPHLMFGLALLLTAARLYVDCWTDPGRWRHLALAVSVMLLGLANPFTLVPLCIMVGAHALVMTCWRRHLDWPGLAAAATTILAAAPLVVANALMFSVDPFWGVTYGHQNLTLTPPLLDLILALGLLVPLAALALPGVLRALTPGRMLLLVWVVLAVVLMQAPTGVQRRFGIGLHPSLALLAASSALPIWLALRRANWPGIVLARPIATATLAQALFGSSGYTALVAVVLCLAPIMGWPTADREGPGTGQGPYQPTEVVAAGDWLAEHTTPDDLLLASHVTAGYLVGEAPMRVFVGHWVATLNYREKDNGTLWFYAGPLDDDRRAFLVEHGIDYVVYGPHERVFGGSPGGGEGLEDVFSSSGLDIYKVVPKGAQAVSEVRSWRRPQQH